jgi:hypothetical protein
MTDVAKIACGLFYGTALPTHFIEDNEENKAPGEDVRFPGLKLMPTHHEYKAGVLTVMFGPMP